MMRALILVSLVALAGCGGGNIRTPPSVVGTWSGAFLQQDVVTPRNQGTATITVSADGSFAGSLTSSSGGLSGTITGQILIGPHGEPLPSSVNMHLQTPTGRRMGAQDNWGIGDDAGQWYLGIPAHWIDALGNAVEFDYMHLTQP